MTFGFCSVDTVGDFDKCFGGMLRLQLYCGALRRILEEKNWTVEYSGFLPYPQFRFLWFLLSTVIRGPQIVNGKF